MTLRKRIGKILGALLTALCAWLVLKLGESGFMLVSLLLSFGLVIFGVRNLIFYFTMARHMVGGRTMLYRAVIVFDMGMFTLTLTDIPTIYVMLYLIGIHAFSGTIDILLALESKRSESAWKLGISHGIMDVLIALLCLVFLGSVTVAIYIYSFGLCYSGVMRIIRGVRRTAIVYIQ